MKKQFLIVGAIAVAAVLGFYALKGTRVPPDGTQGAIGAAQKYQSEQIANSDVSLDSPEVAAFLQTDTFRRIATNAEFRKAVTSEAFRNAISNEAFAAVVSDANHAQIVSDNAHLFASEELTAVASDLGRIAKSPGYAEAMKSAEFKRLVASTGGAQAVAELSRTVGPSKAEALVTTAEFHQWAEAVRKAGAGSTTELAQVKVPEALASNAEFKKLMKSESFQASLATEGFISSMAGADMAKVLGNPRVVEMLSMTEAAKVYGSPQMTEMMSNTELAKSLANPSVAELLSTTEAGKAFSNPSVAEALQIPGVAELLTNPAMIEALQHTEFLAAAASPDFERAVESARSVGTASTATP